MSKIKSWEAKKSKLGVYPVILALRPISCRHSRQSYGNMCGLSAGRFFDTSGLYRSGSFETWQSEPIYIRAG
jgi:hypothetical protein